MYEEGSVLVGCSCADNDEAHAVLIVGRQKPRKVVEIINAFQGKDAVELYKKLTTKKENKL